MIEKVNPKHPDKIADRIAGAITDLVYAEGKERTVATELLIGHKHAHIIIETNSNITHEDVKQIVERIAGELVITVVIVPQDSKLQQNQRREVRAGDNGIFRGVPLTGEELILSQIARDIYREYPYDGKYVLDNNRLIISQSNAKQEDLEEQYPGATINQIGYWTGGLNVDTGAVNRKLGSDQAQSVTGGGLHGKDLSKADVAVNIYVFLKAQRTQQTVEVTTAIGDEIVDGKPYQEIVDEADEYIQTIGGFEKFAEWGLY